MGKRMTILSKELSGENNAESGAQNQSNLAERSNDFPLFLPMWLIRWSDETVQQTADWK